MREWRAFDEDADCVLEATLAGSVDKKVQVMATIVYNMGVDRFGALETKTKTNKTGHGNRRESQISQIRGELRSLTRVSKQATEQERPALEELRRGLREKLKSLRRAENNRRKMQERRRKRAQFTASPF